MKPCWVFCITLRSKLTGATTFHFISGLLWCCCKMRSPKKKNQSTFSCSGFRSGSQKTVATATAILASFFLSSPIACNWSWVFGSPRNPFRLARKTRRTPSNWHSEIVVDRLECWWLLMATGARRRNRYQHQPMRSDPLETKRNARKMRCLYVLLVLWHNQVTSRPSSGRMQLQLALPSCLCHMLFVSSLCRQCTAHKM